MKKSIIALSILLSGVAVADESWSVNGNAVALWHNGERAAVYQNDENTQMIGITFKASCDPSIYKSQVDNKNVNGTLVKMWSACNSGVKDIIWYAQTEKGTNYIINEFKTKSTVLVDGYSFSGRGFSKAFSEINSKTKGGI